MGNRYVTSTITRQTQAVSQQGFGTPLILATSKVAAYKEYTDATGIHTDFGAGSNESKLADALFGQVPCPAKVGVIGILYDNATTSQLTDALDTLILTHNDWYYLLCPSQADADITALSGWIGSKNKLYAASTSNNALAATLVNDRVFFQVHNDPTKYPAEAWVGRCAPLDIGSFTWTFKTLSGIPASTYDGTVVNTIHTNKGNTYISEGGVLITSNGVCTSGEHIDVMQSLDYINAKITENVYGLLVRMPKVPFTVDGIGLVRSEIEKALKQAYNSGIIAEDKDGNPLFTITMPSLADISTNDKAARKLPNAKWQATIAGAVENVDVKGELSV